MEETVATKVHESLQLDHMVQSREELKLVEVNVTTAVSSRLAHLVEKEIDAAVTFAKGIEEAAAEEVQVLTRSLAQLQQEMEEAAVAASVNVRAYEDKLALLRAELNESDVQHSEAMAER